MMRKPDYTRLPTHRLALPLDDGVLSDMNVQWWYWTGHLDGRRIDHDGKRTDELRHFGFEVVFFTFKKGPLFFGTMAHHAISDVDRQYFCYDQYFLPYHEPVREDGKFRLLANKAYPVYRFLSVIDRTMRRTVLSDLSTLFVPLAEKLLGRKIPWRQKGFDLTWGLDNSLSAKRTFGFDHLRSSLDGHVLVLQCDTRSSSTGPLGTARSHRRSEPPPACDEPCCNHESADSSSQTQIGSGAHDSDEMGPQEHSTASEHRHGSREDRPTGTHNLMRHYNGWAHPYAAGGYTYAYSRPRMPARGTLMTYYRSDKPPEVYEVHGDVWFDRQFGDLYPVLGCGYQWFGIQLEDGRNILMAKLSEHQKDDGYACIQSAGRDYQLKASEFRIEELDFWQSPKTNQSYPSKWRIEIPAHDLSMIVTPSFPNQELVPPTWWYYLVSNAYWEGACEVTGLDGSLKGRAYVEINNWPLS